MKQIINRIGLLIGLVTVMLYTSSCEENLPGRTASPEVSADCQSMYFDVTKAVNEFQLKLADPRSVSIVIKRNKTEDAGTVSIVATVNTENIFTIPQSVSFAAGQDAANLTITFPEAELGIPYTATLHLEGENVNEEYIANKEVSVVVTCVVDYDPIPVAIYVDGSLTGKYNAPGIPMYVDAEIATYPTGKQQVRLTNVYKKEPTSEDSYGILNGFAYTEESEFIEGNRIMLVDIDGEVATMQPTGYGIDWGDGELQTGSINPFLSTSPNYPKGIVVRNNIGEIQYIEFGVSSLFFYEGEEGPYVSRASTFIYFSLEAFLGE